MPLLRRTNASQSDPPPVLFSNGTWKENDGNWSTFDVSVGTPPQIFQFLASNNQANISLPFSTSCINDGSTQCFAYFQSNGSSTWTTSNSTSGFDILYHGDQNLGNHSISNSSESPSSPNVGFLGLGAVASTSSKKWEYSDPNPNNLSFLQSLKGQKLIPSVSFGYTAGAWYRDSEASLVLGGYDAARLVQSNASFNFFADRDTAVSVNMTMMSFDGVSLPEKLLSDAVVATFDFSTPFLSLPSKTCGVLQSLLGLQLDHRTGVFAYNTSTYKELQNLRPNMTFSLSNMGEADAQVNITLSYESLALLGSPPAFPSPTWFFPMKVAQNESQAILGRAFFQEVYTAIDYERNNFTVAQASFSNESNITTIKPLPAENFTALIVIIVLALGGVAAAIISVCVGQYRMRKRKKRAKKYEQRLCDKWINAHTVDLGMKQGYEDDYVYHFLGLDSVHAGE